MVRGLPRATLVDGAACPEGLAVHGLSPAGPSGAGSGGDGSPPPADYRIAARPGSPGGVGKFTHWRCAAKSGLRNSFMYRKISDWHDICLSQRAVVRHRSACLTKCSSNCSARVVAQVLDEGKEQVHGHQALPGRFGRSCCDIGVSPTRAFPAVGVLFPISNDAADTRQGRRQVVPKARRGVVHDRHPHRAEP